MFSDIIIGDGFRIAYPGDPMGVSTFGGRRMSAVSTGVLVQDPTGIAAFDVPRDIPSLIHTDPLIQFYQIETKPDDSGSTEKYYVCSFGDSEPPEVPGQVVYDGNTYLTVPIGHPEVGDSVKGQQQQVTVAIGDPEYALLEWVADRDWLRGATVTMYLENWSNRGVSPTTANTRILSLLNITSTEGPSRLVFTMGPPPLFDREYPVITINRSRCINLFQARFNHDFRNYCNYPSTEWENDTKQDYLSDDDAETPFFNGGWFAVNAFRDRIFRFRSGHGDVDSPVGDQDLDGSTDRCLNVRVLGGSINDYRWRDTNRNGPYLYRKIRTVPNHAADEEVDVICKMKVKDSTSIQLEDFHCGILIQSRTDANDWTLFGPAWKTGGTQEVMVRENVNGSDTILYQEDLASETSFRIKREGTDVWKYYTRNDDTTKQTEEPDGNSGWTLVHTSTGTLDIPFFGINVGVCVSKTSANTGAADDELVAQFFHLRYLKGGEGECNRSLPRCQQLRHEHQFNAFRGLPVELVRF